MAKNFKEMDEALRLSFGKIRKDMKNLEESLNEQKSDMALIRGTLLEFNNIKKRLESIEKELKKGKTWEKEETPKKSLIRRAFSRNGESEPSS